MPPDGISQSACAAFRAAARRGRAVAAEARRGGAGADCSGCGRRHRLPAHLARIELARASRPVGVAGRTLRCQARRRSRRRCASSTRSSRSSSTTDAVLGTARRLSDALRLSDHAGGGLGRRTAPRSGRTRTRSPRSIASALATIEREDAFDFTAIPRKHAPRDPLPSPDEPDPRPDGGADLPVPRGAGRARHPRHRTGTAGFRLEVTMVNAALT